MTDSQAFVSIGKAASLLQELPVRISAAARELDIPPAMRLNGVDHFTEVDIQKIASYLRDATTSAS